MCLAWYSKPHVCNHSKAVYTHACDNLLPGTSMYELFSCSKFLLLLSGLPYTSYDVQTNIYMKSFLEYRVIPWCHGLWSGVFCLGLSMRFAELEFSVEYGLVRAPHPGGGSNAPPPAVSVPHIDVNADGRRARRASVEEEFWKNC